MRGVYIPRPSLRDTAAEWAGFTLLALRDIAALALFCGAVAALALALEASLLGGRP